MERPGGEDSRAIGPFKSGESSYFMSLNRGKRSIALDLKTPEGVEVFRKLCREADVLVGKPPPRRHGPPGRRLGGSQGREPPGSYTARYPASARPANTRDARPSTASCKPRAASSA